MDPLQQHITNTRRDFLATSASGLGTLALASLLGQDGLLAASESAATDPLAPKASHFAPKAKNCIFIFMAGAPSQLDLFDPKPKLNELHGKPLPESLTKNVRFAFIKKESAVLIGSKRKFKPHGECGMELSDVLPQIGTCADDIALIRSMHSSQFNHHPGQLLMTSGVPRFGFPSVGSWLNYGLGTASRDLPGYVVLTSGRGASGGASNWTSGFLPSTYQGVLFRNKGEPVLNLNNPGGLSMEMQKQGLETLTSLNQSRYERIRDPEIASRIASYELAYRMQSAAPDLIDLSSESKSTLDAYGVGRTEEGMKYGRGGGKGYVPFVLHQLPARATLGRTGRSLYEHHPRLLGPSQQPRYRKSSSTPRWPTNRSRPH